MSRHVIISVDGDLPRAFLLQRLIGAIYVHYGVSSLSMLSGSLSTEHQIFLLLKFCLNSSTSTFIKTFHTNVAKIVVKQNTHLV